MKTAEEFLTQLDNIAYSNGYSNGNLKNKDILDAIMDFEKEIRQDQKGRDIVAVGDYGFLEIANDLSLKRAEFCKKMGPCPECKTDQVQLLGWPEKPYCKCRNCKHEWGKK